MKTLFEGATVVPMTSETARYRYMGIENGRIIYVGNGKPSAYYDKVVKLAGGYIYPALCDSHLHLLYSIVLSACAFNICSITEDGIKPDCLEEVGQAITSYAKSTTGSGLIMVNQYIPSGIKEGRLPYASELDKWTRGRETVVFTMDGHSCSLSTPLARKLGIETRDGILSGADYDMNQGKITNYAASTVTIGTLARGVANFTNTCLDYGIGKVCALDGEDTGSGKDMLLSLLVFIARRMNIGVRLYPEYMDYSILKRLGKKMRRPRIGGCSKWELDGSVGSHSAAFYHPYKDSGTTGCKYYNDDRVIGKIRQALESGYQPTCHAIGTAAIDQITGAYEVCEALIPSEGPMPRIDHFEFPSSSAVDFVRTHRLAVTVQPGYAYADKKYLHTYEQHLIEETLKLIVPLRDLAEAGTCILGSSDSPVQSVNPYEQMRGMMDYYDGGQSLTAYQALAAYTVNPGQALGEKWGVLREGYDADFFITDGDILQADKNSITDIRAKQLYIGGRLVQRRRGTVSEFLRMCLKVPARI